GDHFAERLHHRRRAVRVESAGEDASSTRTKHRRTAIFRRHQPRAAIVDDDPDEPRGAFLSDRAGHGDTMAMPEMEAVEATEYDDRAPISHDPPPSVEQGGTPLVSRQRPGRRTAPA